MRLLCPSTKIQYLDPTAYLYELNVPCKVCGSMVKYYDSITVCQCQLFTHQICYLKTIKPLLSAKRRFICLSCEYEIKLDVEEQCQCKIKCRQIISILFALIGLILVGILCSKGLYNWLISSFYVYVIVGFGLTVLGITTFLRHVRIYIKKLGVKPTKHQTSMSKKQTTLERLNQ